MNKRVIAALVAVALAAMGVVFLVNYAGNANERAYDGATLESVLQVEEPIAANTKAEDVAARVSAVELPRSAIAKGAVRNLDEVDGLTTTVDLEPGEQLLVSRFAANGATSKEEPKSKSAVPVGMQEITIPLGSARAVADNLKVGDKVGVLASYQTKEGDGVTQMIRNRVLITRIVGPGVKWDGQPVDNVTKMITVAVKTRDAGKIVNALEYGKIWLTKQYADTEYGQGGSISRNDVTE